MTDAKARLDEKKKHSKFLESFAMHQTTYAHLPGRYASSIYSRGHFMPSENQNINLSSTGDVVGIAGGDISGVIGQEVSGAVSGGFEGNFNLLLEQLRESEKPELAKFSDLLDGVRGILEDPNSALSEKDKQKALRYLSTLGELGTEKKNGSLRQKAETAIDALTGILSKGGKLWSVSEPLLEGIQAFITSLG
ncbi:MAG: hypothetical protein AAF821_21775 [Cyanobacteria bacterium P01_D01_bin.156]